MPLKSAIEIAERPSQRQRAAPERGHPSALCAPAIRGSAVALPQAMLPHSQAQAQPCMILGLEVMLQQRNLKCS